MNDEVVTGLGDWVQPAAPEPEKPHFDTVSAPLSEMPQRAVMSAPDPAPEPTAIAPGQPGGGPLAVATKELTPETIAKLARELVHNIRDPNVIYAEYGLTPEQFEEQIKPNPLFAHAVQALVREWNEATNTPKRLRVQAQAILEDCMPAVGARMSDKKEPLSSVVSAFQAISKIGGVGEEKAAAPTGEKFTITINLGADTLTYDKVTGPPLKLVEAADDSPQDLPT